MKRNNISAMNEIKGLDPKLAKHVLDRNDLINSFAEQALGGIDVLDQPVCRHCERFAAWDQGGTAYCFVCGTTTENPITVRAYLLDLYEKHLTPEQKQVLKSQRRQF